MFMGMELARRGEMGPTDRSYWVLPGRFAAGAYPDPIGSNSKLDQLLAAGINVFVNLTQDYPGGTDAHMNRYDVPATDNHAVIVHRRIPDNGTTTWGEMAITLDLIDRHLGHGCNVYVHCWGGSGRTGTVAGCWLRRHGYTGAYDGLELLRTLRLQGDRKGGSKATPQTWGQKRMVEEWRGGR